MSIASHSLARRGAAFGLLAAAASGPGQTFFIGMFGVAFQLEFGLTPATLGALYGVATLAAGLLMFWLGALADRIVPGRAIALAVAVTAAGAVVVAAASVAWQLGIGLLLLRLGGQGLAGHFAIVVAVRYGGTARGRTVAIAAMGFMLAEALFPMLVTGALGVVGWREVWIATPLLLVALLLPMLWIAKPFPLTVATASVGALDQDWTRRRLFQTPRFLAVLATVLVPAFVVTAVFFHQTTLAAHFGWTAGAVARAFIVYAVCQAAALILAGRFVDRFGARSLVAGYLLPLAGGLLATVFAAPATALWLLFAGLGITAGANSVVAGAVWAEVFGQRSLGLVRGVYAGCMVLSSAVSPVLVGALLSAGAGVPALVWPMAAYAIVVPVLLGPLVRR